MTVSTGRKMALSFAKRVLRFKRPSTTFSMHMRAQHVEQVQPNAQSRTDNGQHQHGLA